MSYTVEPFLGSGGNGVLIEGGVTHEELVRLRGAYAALYADEPEVGVQGRATDESGAPVIALRQYMYVLLEQVSDGYSLVERAGMRMSVRPYDGKWEHVRLQGHKLVWMGDPSDVI